MKKQEILPNQYWKQTIRRILKKTFPRMQRKTLYRLFQPQFLYDYFLDIRDCLPILHFCNRHLCSWISLCQNSNQDLTVKFNSRRHLMEHNNFSLC